MTFKPYACCGHTFAAVDAAREIRTRERLAAADVERIEIATYGKALEVAGNPNPLTSYEAKFSLPYCVAVALATGSARLEAFTDERLKDDVLARLVKATALSVDPQAEAAYPGQRAATVTVHTRDDHRLSFHAPTRKGDPDNPLSDDEISEKFMELAGPVIGSSEARDLLAVLWRIQSFDDLAALPLPAVGESALLRSAS